MPSVRNVIAGLIAEGVAATCVTVDLEAGYSGRTADDVRTIAQNRRTLYRNLPIAEHHGAIILHYDSDFEHIAAVTGQQQLWVAPRGTL